MTTWKMTSKRREENSRCDIMVVMRKGRLVLAAIATAMLLTPSVFAQTSDGVSPAERAPNLRSAGERAEERTRLLQGIRDQRKRDLIQRIDDRLIEMNKNLTERYFKTITKADAQLSRISGRADELAREGKDDQAVRAAILKAEEAITAAKREVRAQVEKVYSVDFKDEATAKGGLSEARRKLRDDMAALREKIRLAHRATVEALVSLKQLSL